MNKYTNERVFKSMDSMSVVSLIFLIVTILVQVHAASPTAGQGTDAQEKLMDTILGSMDDLRQMVWTSDASPNLDSHLVQRLDRLQTEVTTLSAQLEAMTTQVNTATETTLKLITNIAQATRANSRRLQVLWRRVGQLNLMAGERHAGATTQTPRDIIAEPDAQVDVVLPEAVESNTESNPTEVSGGGVANADHGGKRKNCSSQQYPDASSSTDVLVSSFSGAGNQKSGLADANSVSGQTSLRESAKRTRSPGLELHAGTAAIIKESMSAQTDNGILSSQRHTTAASQHSFRKGATDDVTNDASGDVTDHDSDDVTNDAFDDVTNEEANNDGDAVNTTSLSDARRLHEAIANVTRGSEATAEALAAVISRVESLESSRLSTERAMTNLSKKAGKELDKLHVALRKFKRSQSKVNGEMVNKIVFLEQFSEALLGNMSRKQEKLVVDVSSTLIAYKYLDSTFRIRFRRKFASPPEVFAALSGFATDPDDASLKTETNESRIRELLDSHIYTVQTNFYAVRVEDVSEVDTSGFSIKMYDGRGLLYSAFQWVQVQWIAIGV